MTYKEKYCEDHDVEIEESFYLRSCPCNYNYESLPDDYSKGDCIHPDMECDKCWNREMVTSNPKSKEKLIKSDFPGLKVNDIVLFRDKTLAIVLPNHYSKNGISTFKITKIRPSHVLRIAVVIKKIEVGPKIMILLKYGVRMITTQIISWQISSLNEWYHQRILSG